MKATTCREQILTAAEQITQSKNLNEFTILDVLNYLTHQNTPYKESTIRTHITAKMCSRIIMLLPTMTSLVLNRVYTV